MSNKQKGNLLEDVVALMHEAPGVTIEKRVKLPVQNSKKPRTREIDILLTTRAAGYRVQIAISCKNEKRNWASRMSEIFNLH